MAQSLSVTVSGVGADTGTLTLANAGSSTFQSYKSFSLPYKDCEALDSAETTISWSDLNSNTNYRFTLYSDTNCATSLITAPRFKTLPKKPTKPTATAGNSGELTIAASVTGNPPLDKWQYIKKEGTAAWESDWTDISSTDKALSHTVTGLTNGVDYQFKVRAVNSKTSPEDFGGGTGAESDASTAVSPTGPTLTSSSVTATGATLNMAGHTGNWYYKHTTPGSGTCSTAISGSSTTVSTFTGNTNYTVEAYSDSGCSTSLNTQTSFLTLPPKPSTPTVTGVQAGSALTIASSFTGGSAAITRWEYKKHNGSAWDSNWTTISDTTASVTETITGLTDGTSYQFKVRVVNASGNGAESDASTAKQSAAVGVTVSGVNATNGALTVTWPGNTAPTFSAYKSSAAPYTNCTAFTPAKTSVSWTNLNSNTDYGFTLYTDSGCTTSLVTAPTFKTFPGKPGKPTVTTESNNGELTVASSVTGAPALDKWQYIKKEGTNAWETEWTDISVTSTSLSHTVTGLTGGTNYRFKVRAVNSPSSTGDFGGGTGAESDASDAAQPTGPQLTVTAITATGATLNIANHSGNWYYKHAGGTCSSVVNTTSTTVGSLTANTSYTFTAYSDSACATELDAAPAFPTLPPKPATPTVTANVGSGKLTIASSLTGGSATLTRWEYKKHDGSWDSNWTTITETSTTLSHTVSGLTNSSSYKFKVRAVNASGDGAESDESAAASPMAATLTVSSITATGASLAIGTFSGSTWYYKYTSPDGGTCSSAVTGTSTTVGSLTANTSYTFKAYNDSACATELATATAFPTLPPKPAKPSVTGVIAGGALTIGSSVTGSATLSRWEYKKHDGTWDSNWTTINSTSTTLSHTVSSLTNGTSYKFKVRAVNASGDGAESDESDAKAPAALTVTVSNVAASTGTLTLSWTGHTLPKIGSYKSFSSPYSGCTNLLPDASTVSWTNLKSNTNYRFTLHTNNNCTSKLITAPRFKTFPGKPTTPTVTTDIGSGKLTIASSVIGNPALDKWQYIKKEGTNPWETEWTDIAVTSTSLSYTVTGLTNSTNYQFKVRGVNSKTSPEDFGGGTGAASDASTATQPAAPSLAASNVEAATATLTISNYSPNWYYKYTSPSDGQCSSAVSTSAASLTGLATGTSHTFKAYSDSGCSTELATATAFLTKPGQVSEFGGRWPQPGACRHLGRGNRRRQLQDAVEVRQTRTGAAPARRPRPRTRASILEPHQRHAVLGARPRHQRHRRRRLVNHRNRHAERADAHRHRRHRHWRHAQHGQLRRHLVLQAHNGHLLDGPDREDGLPDAGLEDELHVQRIQRQLLHHGARHRDAVPHQTGQGDRAPASGRRAIGACRMVGHGG